LFVYDIFEEVFSILALVHATTLHDDLLLEIGGLPEDYKVVLAYDIVSCVLEEAKVIQRLFVGEVLCVYLGLHLNEIFETLPG